MSSEIEKAGRLIREGGLVAFPTETVYGLGANALDPMAVARIFEAKQRPTFDPLIVHVTGLAQARDLIASIPDKAKRLASVFWPGPLTLILPKTARVPDLVTSGLPSIAIRVPDHPMALDLIREADRPIAAPSANPFGRVSPTTAEHVRQGLGDKVDLLLDGGPCRIGVESTIISFMTEPPTLLRPGGLPLEEIEKVIGKISSHSISTDQPLAPGQLKDHYATLTPLYIKEAPGTGRRGYLGLHLPTDIDLYSRIEVLSANGDLREAASNLFSAMRRLDSSGLDLIIADPVPMEGLGLAINDRLFKASRKE